MKNIFMVVAIMVLATACEHAIVPVQTPVVNSEIKNTSGQTILAGHASVSILQSPAYLDWYKKSYDAYTVDTLAAEQLKTSFKNKSMDIFLGSWCGDSKREVPRMLKIAAFAGIDTSQIKLVFVDNSRASYKQSPAHEERGRNIHHVPTFIIYDQNKELGRIVESPVQGLEKDLLNIIDKKPYTPSYAGINYWCTQIKKRSKPMSDASLQSLVSTIKPLCRHYGELNTYGYVLMAAKNNAEALNVFRLNTLMYPDTASVFDSWAEALAAIGRKAEAIKAYEKVLDLKPGDENAIKMIARLK